MTSSSSIKVLFTLIFIYIIYYSDLFLTPSHPYIIFYFFMMVFITLIYLLIATLSIDIDDNMRIIWITWTEEHSGFFEWTNYYILFVVIIQLYVINDLIYSYKNFDKYFKN